MDKMNKFDPVRLAKESAQMHATHLDLADILESYAAILKNTCTPQDVAEALLHGRTNLEAQNVLRSMQMAFNAVVQDHFRAVVLQQLKELAKDLANPSKTGGQA